MKGLKRWICLLIGLALIFTLSTATTFAATKPGKVTNATVKSTTYDSINISWKKVTRAAGYEVYRATSKSGTYKLVKTINKGKTVTFSDTKVKSNKKYYYKVRAFKKSGSKKIKGKFSAIFSGKTKRCTLASKTSVTLNPGESKDITITYKRSGTVYWESDDSDIATCSWGEFNNNKCPLTIEAGDPGTTYVYITNSHNNEKIKIKVTVKGSGDAVSDGDYIKVKMIIPQQNTYNYYVDFEIVNYSDETISISSFAAAGSKGVSAYFNGSLYKLGAGKSVTLTYYRSIIPEDRWDDEYNDMYLDKTSTGYIYIANEDDTSGRYRVDFTGDGSYTKYELPW